MDDESTARAAGLLAGLAVLFLGSRAAHAAGWPGGSLVSAAQAEAARALAVKWGSLLGVPALDVQSIMEEESSYNPNPPAAGAGAVGLMQLLPTTARDLAVLLAAGHGTTAGSPARREVFLTLGKWHDTDPAKSLLDPDLNALLGTYYLKRLEKEFGEFELAAAGYQQGPGKVRELLRTHKDVIPHLGPKGREYVAAVLGRRARLAEREA